MNKVYISLVVLFMLGACGPGRLVLDKNMLSGKAVKFKAENSHLGFTEKTMGGLLVHSAASWAAGPALSGAVSAGQTPGQEVSGDASRQDLVTTYSPQEAILAKLRSQLSADLHWQLSESPDYEVSLRNTGWGILHHPIKVTNYKIFYNATLTITEARTLNGSKPKSDWFYCSFETDSKYSYDEVFANNASAVKDAMRDASVVCSNKLLKDVREQLAKK